MNKHLLLIGLSSIILSCSDKKEANTEETSPNKEEEDQMGRQAVIPELKMKDGTPIAGKLPFNITTHGDNRNDDYFWMRLSDEQKEAETPDEQTQRVLDYLNAENAYKDSVMNPTKALQTSLFQEIKGKLKEDDASFPYLDNGYYHYERFEKGKEYEIICRIKDTKYDFVFSGEVKKADEEIILDVNELAEGHDYYDVASAELSPNNHILAYAYDDVSRRQYNIVFKTLSGDKSYNETIENTSGDLVWANDNQTVFYVTKDPTTLRENKVWRHKLGTEQADDVLIFEETDETFYCEISKSKSEEFIFIDSYSTVSTEHRFVSANEPEGDFKVIQERERDLLYAVSHLTTGEFYVLTNEGDAQNFKLMKTAVDNPSKNNWTEVLAHRPETRLVEMEVFKNFLVLHERENGLNKLRILSHDLSTDKQIAFAEETYSASISVNMEYDSETLRYSYSSLKVPHTLYDYNLTNGGQKLLKRKEVVGGYNPDDYETERIWANAKDGTKIPVSLVYKKGLKKDGSNPTLLYGYGSYGVTIPDKFSIPRLSLIDRGFIYAIAHIRGSEYLGRQWYEDGKKLKKMNSFTDFIAASDFLIENEYTNPDKLFAMGGSAGGLLMGAVINLKPQNFKGVIAAVPFVDVVSTMLDESIPLTTGEFDEWGNPKDKEYYDYMLSYSPYDQVKAQDYPNLLITTGYWDSQVQYWEPAKWLAKLRDLKTDDNILIMDCNMSTGHGGASGRYEAYKETAMEYAFLINLLK
jgi:oligopeptidase B